MRRPPSRSLLAALPLLMLLVSFAPAEAEAATKRLEGVVNLNTASVDTLVLLPGLGPAKVEAILLYRRKHPFRTVEELGRVKGIGTRMVRELRPHLAVAGPTTAALVHVKTDWEALRRLETAAPVAAAPGAAVKAPGNSSKARPVTASPAAIVRRPRPAAPRWRRPAAVACLDPA